MRWYIFKSLYAKEVEIRAQSKAKAEAVMANILIRSANSWYEYVGTKPESEVPIFELPKPYVNYYKFRKRNRERYHQEKLNEQSNEQENV